jgi:release factor glutamine methyltransferase
MRYVTKKFLLFEWSITMTLAEAKKNVEKHLSKIYSAKECERIFFILLEHKSGYSTADFFADKNIQLTPEEEEWMNESIARLKKNEPVQYVVGYAYFHGMKLKINPSVLIPRPETEELVSLIIQQLEEKSVTDASILDIGTGSGCIALALKKKFPSAKVSALEHSAKAIETARKNASLLDAEIGFIEADILNPGNALKEKVFDLIVSNPPYILKKERKKMSSSVYDFEPNDALFVPDNSPLLFYNAIAETANIHLRKGGRLWFECNESKADEVAELLKKKNFALVKVHADMSRKKRFVSCMKF